MEANNPCNARRKPPARPIVGSPDDAWHESRAVRMVVAVVVIVAAALVIETVIAAWYWLDAAMRLVSEASAHSAAALPILAALTNDPNVSPAFRKAIDTRKPSTDLLSTAFDKAAPRRFTGAPPSAFAGLDDGLEPVICGDCDGSGEGMHDGSSCRTCGGEGEVME